MSDEPVGSAANFFDTTGTAASGGGLRHSFKESADILSFAGGRGFGIPTPTVLNKVRALAEVRAALGLPAEAGSAESLPAAGQIATACFELHLGPETGALVSKTEAAQLPVPPPQVVIPFQVTVDLATTPYTVLSGTFIFDSTEVTGWQITQGQFGIASTLTSPSVLLTDMLYIVGEFLPIGTGDVEAEPGDSASPAPWVVILGWIRPPLSYPGYFLNSGGGLYIRNTLFRGWQACS
jgi:hypothetical protein